MSCTMLKMGSVLTQVPRSCVKNTRPCLLVYNNSRHAITMQRLISSSSTMRSSNQVSHRDSYKAVVVGAGPAGIATVGNLLDAGVAPVLWIDDACNGGRLNARYRVVPSNTKVSLFIDFANACKSFRSAIDTGALPNALVALQSLRQDKGCDLKYAADLCLQLTAGLKASPHVHLKQGVVNSALQDQSGNWLVTMQSKTQKLTNGYAPLLVLCTGSFPNKPALPEFYPNLKAIDLDLALNPPQLAANIPDHCTIAVIGASHSAILVLRNLYNLASTTHSHLKIMWFSRHPLRYAEPRDGWILRDNTGLKGDVAVWAKAHLEPGVFDQSDVSRFIQKVSTAGGAENERNMYKEFLPRCDHVVEAVGFTRSAIPELKQETKEGHVSSLDGISWDNTTGGLLNGQGARLPGLFGVGIAWPEGVTDPEGNKELSVGMWKFMKYVKRIVPAWKESVFVR